MTNQTHEQGAERLSPTAMSFAQHLSAFRAGLPQDEQALLDQICALANAAAGAGDVSGYDLQEQIDQARVQDHSAQAQRNDLFNQQLLFGLLNNLSPAQF
jgi:hypothetical protein